MEKLQKNIILDVSTATIPGEKKLRKLILIHSKWLRKLKKIKINKYNTLYTNIKNILLILNRKQKIKSIILVILIFGITLIELICLFSVYEIVRYSTSILTSNSVDGNNYIEKLFSLIGFSYELKNLGIILIFLYLFKFVYILSINRIQYKFTNSVKVYLNVLLLKKYLSKNYVFFLDNNPAKLLRNVDMEVSQFILGCLLQIIILLTELLFLIALVISLAFFHLVYKIF